MNTEHVTLESNIESRNRKCNDISTFSSIIKNHSNDTFKFVLLNARSISSMDRYESFKELLSILDCKFDIIVVCETWIKEDLISMYELENYHSLHSCRKNEGNGGVAIYYRKNLEATKITTIYNHNYNMIQALFRLPLGVSMYVTACYRSPINSNVMLSPFMYELEDLLQVAGSNRSILLGDFNLDANTLSPQFLQYQNLLESYDYKICNSNNTREGSGTRIDHIVSNFTESFEYEILTCPLVKEDIFYSDHSIVANLLKSRTQYHDVRDNGREYKHTNHGRIEIELNEKLNQENLQQFRDPDLLSAYIVNTIQESLAKNEYTRQRKVVKNVCEWMNEDIIRKITEKDNRRKTFRQNPTAENEASFKDASKKLEKVKKKA